MVILLIPRLSTGDNPELVPGGNKAMVPLHNNVSLSDEKVTLDFGRTLQQARVGKSWTQKDLATVSVDIYLYTHILALF